MRIRGGITHELMGWKNRPDRPLDDEAFTPENRNIYVNPDLYSPPNAPQLAAVREHCLQNPEGILLDAYQSITALELKYPPGSPQALSRYILGLQQEATELAQELGSALQEHPYQRITEYIDGPETSWLLTVLDFNRLRFLDLTTERKEKCLGEMGDILWYSSRLAAEAGTPLSRTFISFLRQADVGKLGVSYASGFGQDIEAAANAIMDFRMVQDIALSQKLAFSIHINRGTPIEERVTIDNAPYILLNRIVDEDLSSLAIEDTIAIEAAIGKLLWFVAYTSSSLLNADFAVVMQANLKKITARSQRGTIFSRQDRSSDDEAKVSKHHSPRFPLTLFTNPDNASS